MNIYYTPEAFGLKVYGEAEAGGGYDFDTFAVWSDGAGRFAWAEDSGCSCPSPFEDVSLANVKRGTLRDALTDLRAWAGAEEWSTRRREAARALAARMEEELGS